MISLETAQKLKQAGLKWSPALHDFFAIPERNLDERIFVISDLLVTVEMLGGLQIVSFQGASEWALDYLVAADALWMPREDQLRSCLEALLLAGGSPEIQLTSGLGGYSSIIRYRDEQLAFDAGDASEAYSAALLYLLKAKS
jgi:hypothetical protein